MKRKKTMYWLGFWCVIGLSALFYYVGPENIEKYLDDSSDKLAVYVLDVGQGDAIFIETPDDYQILIDGGPDKNVLYELGKVMGFWDRSIDAVVLTHPHSDHVGGMVEVLRRYQIDKVYMTGVVHTSSDYLTFLNVVNEKDIPVHEVSESFVLNLDNDINFEFLYPLQSFARLRVENLNNTSIVNRLVYNDTSILLTGDLETEGEEELIASNQDLSVDILKAGHHGSSTSSKDEFLITVRPDYAVISVSDDNSFGHPSSRTLKRMERLGIKVFRTDQQGMITLISDGLNWQIEPGLK